MKHLYVLISIGLFGCGSEEHGGRDASPTVSTLVPGTSSEGAQGPKGDTGPQGPKGDKGDKGDATIGAAGKDGRDGTDGKPVDPNEWYDPITDRLWLLGGITAAPTCGGNFVVPTVTELQAGRAHGLFTVYQGAATAWSSTIGSNGEVQYVSNAGGSSFDSRIQGQPATFQNSNLCVERP